MTTDVMNLEIFISPLKMVSMCNTSLFNILEAFSPPLYRDSRALKMWFVMERTSKAIAMPSRHYRVGYHSVLVVLCQSEAE